jgi:hypothetical protein
MLLPKIPLDKLNRRLKQRDKMLNNAGDRIDAFVNYHMVVPKKMNQHLTVMSLEGDSFN